MNSKCAECDYMLPHYYLRRMLKPEVVFPSGEEDKQKEWEDIPSRWYVGAMHGTAAEELGAICSECDDGVTTVPVFCRNHTGNSYNIYTKYPNHSFWYTVKKSLHPMGKLDEEEE